MAPVPSVSVCPRLVKEAVFKGLWHLFELKPPAFSSSVLSPFFSILGACCLFSLPPSPSCYMVFLANCSFNSSSIISVSEMYTSKTDTISKTEVVCFLAVFEESVLKPFSLPTKDSLLKQVQLSV